MEQNKTGKYFKYAIGEIVLVVIGILIALSINNWNQQKQNLTTMKQFLVEFKEEVRYNINDLKREFKFVEKQIEQKQNLLKNKRLDTIPLDTLEYHITARYVNLAYNPMPLKRFENSQITDYGKYDSIFIRLQQFFGFQWPRLEKFIVWQNNEVDAEDAYWRHRQNSYELKLNLEGDTFISDSITRKKALIELIKTPLVRNMLKADYSRKKDIKNFISSFKDTAEKRFKKINEILDD